MNNEDALKKIYDIGKEIFDPTSELYLDNLLDLAASISYDIHCSGTWKNSKPIKAFLNRYSNFSDKISKLRVSLNDFSVIKTVGQGGFGRVDLVRHKQTKNIYAMKIMDKNTFVQNSFSGFWEERDIMAKNSSDWLIKCFYTFMDLKKLYIVMEYMPGGDLYHWMTELEDFSDEQTHFYAMEMVLAVEYLHKMGFIHRDLKPDNMLLDKNGHMKLADFGTCIRVQDGKVKTNFQIGTPDYISPEVLRNTGVQDLEVGFEIDWWAFGIVIYELFYGETPFEGESTSTLYQNIMCYKKTLIYPDDKPAKSEFIDFLSKILTEPNERMGIKEIKQHPYLTNSEYKWTFNTIREFQSPVIFQVTGEDDTNYITYDPNDRRNNISYSFNNNNYFSGENLAFTGFTFNRFDHYNYLGNGYANGPNSSLTGRISGDVSFTELEVKLSEMELSKQQLSVKLDSKNKELNRIQATLVNAEKELIEKEQLINAKKMEYSTTLDSNKQLKSKIESLTKQNEGTQREIEQLKIGVQEKENLIRTLKMDNCNLTDEISNLQVNLQTKEEKLDKITGELDEKISQMDTMKKLDYLLEEEKSHTQNLMSEIDSKNRKISEYESQLEVMNNNVIDIQARNLKSDAVISNTEELELLLIEKQKLEVRLSHTTNDLNHMESLKNAAQLELTNEKQKKQELEKMRDKLAKDISNQKMVVASLQNKLNSAEDQKKVLKQRINIIESEKDQIEQQKKMFESMVEVRKAENEGTLAELEEAEEMFQKKEKELEWEKYTLQVKFDTICKDYEGMKQDSVEKSKKLEEHKFVILENDNLSQRIDKFKQELEEKKSQISDFTKVNSSQKSELEKTEKELVNERAKVKSLVDKLDEIMSNPKAMPQMKSRKKKDYTNNGSVRRIKQLETDLSKEKVKFQEKVNECNEVKNDCQHWQEVNKELKAELDNKNIMIKDLNANLMNSNRPPKATSTDDLSKPTELKCLEGKIDVFKKGKGRHKICWIPSFGLLKPFKLDIFQNDNDNAPSISIDLRHIIHIREPSAAECVHIEKGLLPKVLQIIYEKQELSDDIRRQSLIPLDVSRRSKSSTMNLDDGNESMRSSMIDITPSNGIYSIENHSFVPMRFRSYTNCDVCHLSCSDLLNPPSALECANCKNRIHMEHIYSNEFKIQWCQRAIEVLLLKVESQDAKLAWLNCLNQLKEYQKTNEVQIAPNTFYRSVRNVSQQSNTLSVPGRSDS